MPLDRTGRRKEWGVPSRAVTRQAGSSALGLVTVVAVALLLVGCNTGSMTEARRSQAFDEAETPQLSAQQATQTARTFFAPTGTPAATMVPPPSIEALVVTLGVNPDGSPAGSYLSVPVDAGTVYAAAQLGNVVAGQRVSAVFTDAFGNQYAPFEVEMSANAAAQWLAAPINLAGTSGPGEYAVYFYCNGHQIGSLAFTVAGAGAGAQLLPDLPANPQARSTTVSAPAGQPTAASGNANQGGQNQEPGQATDGNGQQQADGSGQQQGDGTWQQQADGTWQQQPDGTWQQQNNGQWQQQQAPADGQWQEQQAGQ